MIIACKPHIIPIPFHAVPILSCTLAFTYHHNTCSDLNMEVIIVVQILDAYHNYSLTSGLSSSPLPLSRGSRLAYIQVPIRVFVGWVGGQIVCED